MLTKRCLRVLEKLYSKGYRSRLDLWLKLHRLRKTPLKEMMEYVMGENIIRR